MTKWFLRLLTKVLENISPDIRVAIVQFVKDLDKKAKDTPNPWDDIGVDVLAFLLQVDLD